MGPVCIGYISEPPENQTPPLVGPEDLFGAVEVELGYTNLIRISSLI